MCGIAGMLDIRRAMPEEDLQAAVNGMARALAHRGPDDSGIWVDAAAGVALAHRRLSILDLSLAGHQPMTSASGRYVIVFNGEIYNYLELREELKREIHGGLPLRGHSDTEVLLFAVEHWGLESAIRRLNGMFAFGLWDRWKRILHLCRDRLGEKPLYYGWMKQTFLFGSELKALRVHPAFREEIDRDAIALFLRHNCIPAPYSIYAGVKKLRPAALLSIRCLNEPESRLEEYWSLKDAAERGMETPFRGSDEEAIEQLDALLRDAVKIRMISDVPIGSFLSGGVDSSTVTALMQAQSSRTIRTFTIGNRNPSYNEANHAASVAKHLGTDHTELYVSPEQARQVIPRLPAIYDEPFADSSQIPTLLLSQLTRQFVTVGLSGDGGDEIFGGYNRHLWCKPTWKTIGWMPRPLRRGTAALIHSLPAKYWDALWQPVGPILPKKWIHRRPGYNLYKLAGLLGCADLTSFYHGTTSHWLDPASVALSAGEPQTVLASRDSWPNLSDFEHQMMYLDSITYLPDDILTKVDRATMAVSLEARAPLLDHRVVEFAWKLPLHSKIRIDEGKWIFRQVLYRYVPRELLERPKSGFGIPVGEWLRGPLRDWAESLLDSVRLGAEGYFNTKPIQEKWREHLSGQREWESQLWGVLMFQAWLEESRKSGSSPSEIKTSFAMPVLRTSAT